MIKLVNNQTNYYFIGIGGINMSALAEILHQNDYTVSGSDKNDSAAVQHLLSLGIHVNIGHCAENMPQDAQVVVYNAAVAENNPERAEGVRRGLIMLDRAELLGLLMQNYQYPICVAGTHGKTTTTSMLAEIFMAADANPTVLSGGVLPSMGGAWRAGDDKYFIAEACEYHNSFLKFHPYIGVILNIEMDHGDFFDGEEGLRRSFRTFAEKIPTDGALIINEEIKDWQGFVAGLQCKIIPYKATNLGYDLAVPGIHNISNANAALACTRLFGLDEQKAAGALQNFTGAKRRFEKKGLCNNAQIIDDYAHHPTEVSVTLTAAKTQCKGNLWVVFQPHTHNRTAEFLDEFAQALAIADKAILVDIYRPAGREEEQANVHSQDLVKKIGGGAIYMPSFKEAANHAKTHLKDGDMLITMGAGDVYKIANMILDPQK
ncbi:MAG: UDP-N-acetylmuramate--L-alanine ligase [Defluviitaleaceae bacterium]|nr:UDP-N-acetylmuramate--L-alanine ligase [Defluviitaleaceae bacterium]